MAAKSRKRAPSRRVKLDDLAQRCGVSVSTVSRALTGAGGVRPELVAEIRRAAQDYNYAVPSSVSGRRVVVLASTAAMVDYARSQFTLNVMEGLTERARLLGVDLVTRAVDPARGTEGARAAVATDPEADGLLLLTLDAPEMLEAAAAAGRPAVLVNGDDPQMRLSSVAPNNRAAGALAAGHLLALGHRRILFLMRRGRRTIERRHEGWRDAVCAAGCHDPGLVVEVADWLPELAEAAVAARLAARGRDFTAVLAAGDSLATGAIRALAAAGVAVPGEVSVMGMDGLPQGAFHDPPLTAIEMPMRALGAGALDLLRDLLTGLPLPARRIELACTLVDRGSTGPCPA